jgi:hypothetical protein
MAGMNRLAAQGVLDSTRAILAADIASSLGVTLAAQVEQLEAFARAVSNIARSNNPEFRRVLEAAAERGREAALRSYKSTRQAGRRSYRSGDSGRNRRYADGKMEEAIKEGFFKINDKGVQLIMPNVFDKRAKQWYRLNYGARPARQLSAIRSSAAFFGAQVKMPEMNFSPSAPFSMPPGIWSDVFLKVTPRSRSELLRRGGSDLGMRDGPWGPNNPLFAFAGPTKGTMARDRQRIRSSPRSSYRGGDAFYPIRDRSTIQNARRMTRGITGMRFLDRGMAEFHRQLVYGMEALTLQMMERAAGQAKTSSGKKVAAPSSISSAISQRNAASVASKMRANMENNTRNAKSAYNRFGYGFQFQDRAISNPGLDVQHRKR